MVSGAVPQGWGDDALTVFFEQARANSFGVFVEQSSLVQKLIDIDQIFARLFQGLTNPLNELPSFLAIRAHSAYRVAAFLCMNTQAPESKVMARFCLEYGLYSWYISTDFELGEIWLSRDDSNLNKKAVQNSFRIGDIFAKLSSNDPNLSKIAKGLYDWTLDSGAHPNLQGVFGQMSNPEDGIKVLLLTNEQEAISESIKTTARVGVAALLLIEKVLMSRFTFLGLSDELREVTNGL